MLITINQLTELYLECEDLEPVLKSLAYSVIELLKVDTVLVYTFNPHTNGRIHQICVGENLVRRRHRRNTQEFDSQQQICTRKQHQLK